MDNDKSSRWNFSSDEDTEPASNDIFQKRPDFFQSFMSDRLGSSGGSELRRSEETEEDDDEDDETDKPSRAQKKPVFSGFLKALSPDTEPKTSTYEEREPSRIPDSSELPSKLETTAAENSSVSTESMVEPEGAANIHELPHTDQTAEDKPPQTEEFSNEDVVEIEHQPAERVSQSETEESTSADTPNSEAAQNYVRYSQSGGETPGRNSESAAQKPGRSPSENRGGGALLAFLGAEFLSRRRDRKLSREIKTNEKIAKEKIEHLKQSQLTQREAQESLRIHQQKQIDKLAAAQAEKSQTISSPKTKYENIPRPATPDTTVTLQQVTERIYQTQHAEDQEPIILKKEAPVYPPPYAGINPEHRRNETTFTNSEEAAPIIERRDTFEIPLPVAAEKETLIRGRSMRQTTSRPISPVIGFPPQAGGYSNQPSQTGRPDSSGKAAFGISTRITTGNKTYRQAVGAGVLLALLIFLFLAVYYLV